MSNAGNQGKNSMPITQEKMEITNRQGRPTLYKEEYNEKVVKLCRLGATDKEIADFFDIEESTLNLWKHAHPIFVESMKKGKIDADANVANSLYKRALGYEHPEDDIKQCEGNIIITPTIKRYPPDSTAMIFWLKNRRSKEWRDKTESDINMTVSLADQIKKAYDKTE